MQPFTQPEMRQIRFDLEAVLDKFAADHGLESVKFEKATGSYDNEGHFMPGRLVVTKKGAVDKSQSDFALYARLYGLEPEDLGKVIVVQGRSLVIAGINPKAPKNAVMFNDLDGKPAGRWNVDSTLRALGREPRASWSLTQD